MKPPDSHVPSFKILMVTSSFPFYSQTFVLKEIEAFKQSFTIKILRIKNSPSVEKSWKSGEEFRKDILNVGKSELFLSNLKLFLRAPVSYLRLLYKIIAGHHRLKDRFKCLVVFVITMGHIPEIKKYAPDHIHAHFGNFPALTAYIINRWLKIPYSFNCHGTDVLIDKQMLGEKGRTAEFVTTVSEYNKNIFLSEVRNTNEIPLHVFYLGTEIPDAMPDTKREKGTLLFVGRLSPEKNIPSLIQALPLIKKSFLKKVWIIGDGSLKSHLREMTHKFGVDTLVSFPGKLSHEELKEYYETADVFILPSIREGLPISILEAMSYGTVAVASNITGVPEIITDTINGYLIQDPLNIEEIAQRIETALQAPDSVRQSGYEKVMKDFKLTVNLQKKVAFFENFLQGKR